MTNDDLMKTIHAALEEPHGPGPRKGRPDWQRLCVCGHLEQHHSESVGGTHPTEWQRAPVDLDGCTGAMRNMGKRPSKRNPSTGEMDDRKEWIDGKWMVPVTCPCKEFRPVAEVDRLGGRFRQRVHINGHPMSSGMRGMMRTVERMAESQGVPVEEILTARFRWTVDLVCERCMSTDGVLPSYTVPGKESGLLCRECREKARATVIV